MFLIVLLQEPLEVTNYLPKFYLEELLSDFNIPKVYQLLSKDGYFYATDFVKVEAKAMAEESNAVTLYNDCPHNYGTSTVKLFGSSKAKY